MSERVEKIVELFMQLNVKELLDLKEALKAEGIEPMAAPAVSTAVMDAPAEAEVAPTTFAVSLSGYGDGQKISVIRGIRPILSLSLKEAKEFVEGSAVSPQEVKKDLSKEMAEELKGQLEGFGGTAEVKPM